MDWLTNEQAFAALFIHDTLTHYSREKRDTKFWYYDIEDTESND